MKDLITCLQQFINNAGTVLKRRAKIVLKDIGVENITHRKSDEIGAAVTSSDGITVYETELIYSNRARMVAGRCDCPYASQFDDTCKHQTALALKWIEILSVTQPEAGPDDKKPTSVIPGKGKKVQEQRAFIFPFLKLDYLIWRLYTPGLVYNRAAQAMNHHKTHYEELKNEKKWIGHFTNGIEAAAAYNTPSSIRLSCNCNKLTGQIFCEHVTALLLYINMRFSPFYFYQFNDYTDEKSKLLASFGVLPSDQLAAAFEFGIDVNGRLIITKKPAYLLNVNEEGELAKIKKMLRKPAKQVVDTTADATIKDTGYDVGILLNFNNETKGFLSIEPVMVFDKKSEKKFKKIPFENDQHLAYLFGIPSTIIQVLKGITHEALVSYLVKQGYGYLQRLSNPFGQLNQAQLDLLNDRWYAILQELKLYQPVFSNFYQLSKGQRFNNNAIKPASLSAYYPLPVFELGKTNGFLRLHCLVEINHQRYPLTEFERIGFLLKSRNEYFLLHKNDLATLDVFNQGLLMVHEKEQVNFVANVVKPLAEKYTVDLGNIINTETIDEQPAASVYLSELNQNFLLIRPKWIYAGLETEDWEETKTIVEQSGTVYTILRKKEAERALIDAIRKLHPKFEYQDNGYFYLNFREALHQNWFLQFYNSLRNMDVNVYGLQELKKFRYNQHPPVFAVKAGQSVDWFDLTIEVSYGDLLVPLQELRKAIAAKQSFILLSDGSLGTLPEEWISKYGLLMRMGEVKDGVLQVSKTNWTLVDKLQLQTNEPLLAQSLEEKKRRLQAIDTDAHFLLPKTIQAVLRDYQHAGFQWMCLLDNWGWGGCLADDMGLGKTLQTICFLQYLANTYPAETNLVVCPTSLIYNWEAELKKFAPRLKYHIHYGTDRVFDKKVFGRAHLIITSYGMVRSDIEHFHNYTFGYVVLDESQAIKNPSSQITKALQLLKARNRIALSGTPVQNNTFDLYAQMHFLNPGLLGTQEFFRTEFANPVDKNGDREKLVALRQLIYPFMLRRTKEQVAKDLPDKTEMILWCEMNTAQRKIYNSFKDYYRESILGRISTDGLGKSSIYILEGLTKLRQICDSPAILNEEESYPNESTKLEELVREISENTGRHKALVFSQFTSMLQLVAQALQQKGIAYLYLDGSVPAANRKKLVQQFQETTDVKIFLISLKAGGVGLNLTAADYVYLVDPWWNPAAEQQAIDRTHRIGQVKKVFAYRMICKDSVEEKILALQQKKKDLAAGLVSDETGFVKKLTKEDISFLFS